MFKVRTGFEHVSVNTRFCDLKIKCLFKLSKVPTEDLIVWNVKDGWKPLCEFLNCSVPPIPIPHDNRTGDTKYAEEYVFKSDFMKRSLKEMKTYIILDLLRCGIFVYVAWRFFKIKNYYKT